jgi:hypothetical protein
VSKIRRGFVLPDRQVKPDVPLFHNKWIGMAIRDYEPDFVVDIGDNADFPSMSQHSAAGSRDKEGQRLFRDLEAANKAEALLKEGMGDFRPKRMVRLRGNHENRLLRYIEANPVLEGLVGLHLLDDTGWEIVPYDNGTPGIVHIDGVAFAHFFAHPNSGKPIGGTIASRIAKIGGSFVQGHQQGLMRGDVQYATGRMAYGLVAGSCYVHDEPYKGAANAHWRGVVVMNEVRNGQFCEMPLTLDYLCRKYEGMSLARYLQRNVRNAKQRFSLARASA